MPVRNLGAARERWVGAQEAARFLGVHRSTLHAAVQQGAIVPDGHTPGGHMRFSLPTLEEFRGRLASYPATRDTSAFLPMRTLASLAHHLVEPTGFDHICRSAVAGIRAALPGIDMCVLATRVADPNDQTHLRVTAQEGFPPWVFEEFHRLRKTFKYSTTATLRSRQPDYCENVDQRVLYAGTERLARALGLGAYATLPLVAADESLGILVCASHSPRTFSEHDRAFLQGVVDELAGVLAGAVERGRLLSTLNAGQTLISAAFALRLEREENRPHMGKPRSPFFTFSTGPLPSAMRLGALFRELTGAEDVCALGFGSDLPPRDLRLLNLSCAACVGDELIEEHWTEDGIPRTGIAASVPLDRGRRGAAAAIWQGKRTGTKVDHALLVTFAGAYLLVVEAP